MLRIEYDIPEMPDEKVFCTDITFHPLQPQGTPVDIFSMSLLASVGNIGPNFGLYAKDKEGKKRSIRVAGTTIIQEKPPKEGYFSFVYGGETYKLFVTFYKVKEKYFEYRCDFVINNIIPHEDSLNLFTWSMDGKEVSIEGLKNLLSDVSIEEEASFDYEAGFILRKLDKPKEVKIKKEKSKISRLNKPVQTSGLIDAFQYQLKSKEKTDKSIVEGILASFRGLR